MLSKGPRPVSVLQERCELKGVERNEVFLQVNDEEMLLDGGRLAESMI